MLTGELSNFVMLSGIFMLVLLYRRKSIYLGNISIFHTKIIHKEQIKPM